MSNYQHKSCCSRPLISDKTRRVVKSLSWKKELESWVKLRNNHRELCLHHCYLQFKYFMLNLEENWLQLCEYKCFQSNFALYYPNHSIKGEGGLRCNKLWTLYENLTEHCQTLIGGHCICTTLAHVLLYCKYLVRQTCMAVQHGTFFSFACFVFRWLSIGMDNCCMHFILAIFTWNICPVSCIVNKRFSIEYLILILLFSFHTCA